MKRIIVIAFILMILSAGCVRIPYPDLQKNEIKLKILLDTEDDIGLLIVESDVNGKKESGGISNADRSMLRHNDVLYWSIDKEHYENISDSVTLTLQFTAVTEYCNPNYENIYPEEYSVMMNELSFVTEFGKEYVIKITGNKVNGYSAIIQ